MQLAAPDFRFDISLGLLSVLVGGAIAVALIWYLAVLLMPLLPRDAAATVRGEFVGPPAWVAIDDAPLLHLRFAPALPALPLVTVFRCDTGGRVSYGDQPCPTGDMRVLHLPRG
jgi:predicted lysophospholipase L1 biosynthesis ABC-type transport system permease subunit